MPKFYLTVPFLAMALATATLPARAAEPVVVLHGSTAAGESTLNLRNQPPASCSAASVGDCGSCAVSCTIGQAAVCKPGKVLAAMGDGSCQREPVCRCDDASPAPATRR